MPEISAAVQLTYESFDDVAPSPVWVEVAAVFSSSFSATPYFEDPDELSQIVVWGPGQVAHVGGRLTIARCAGRVVGFALVHGLEGGDSWEGALSSMASSDSRIEGMVVCPRNVIVVHELAVDSEYRGQGIAKSCLAMALDNRLETDVVLGVYDQAKDARLMYERWGFEDLGTTYIQDGAVMLRVLAARLGELRLSDEGSRQVLTPSGNDIFRVAVSVRGASYRPSQSVTVRRGPSPAQAQPQISQSKTSLSPQPPCSGNTRPQKYQVKGRRTLCVTTSQARKDLPCKPNETSQRRLLESGMSLSA